MLIKYEKEKNMENKYFNMLMTFSGSDFIYKSHLVRKFGKDIYDSAVEKGYIEEAEQVSNGDIFDDVKCTITEEGKKIRGI